MPLYIEKIEIWSGDTDPWHTHSQTIEYRATQLVESIKFNLSHAINKSPSEREIRKSISSCSPSCACPFTSSSQCNGRACHWSSPWSPCKPDIATIFVRGGSMEFTFAVQQDVCLARADSDCLFKQLLKLNSEIQAPKNIRLASVYYIGGLIHQKKSATSPFL